ncbi:MAG TPA: DUF4249 domain-containing protein [Saprospiraceae bacterium]|nr:DUF4249 domain-containing protein [Saprospiraceae bacterium]HNO37565.1 DUF4249 domain-containing protein [Saprospiraceae bacterium]
MELQMESIKMKQQSIFVLLILAITSLSSCEEEFIPEISSEPAQIVVEGYIEAGEGALPPFVILTRSTPFFSEFSQDTWSKLFVHDAKVVVNDGVKDYVLNEICSDDLTPEMKKNLSTLLGVDLDSSGIDFCAYLDLSFGLKGKEGGSYRLSVHADGQMLDAVTSIPQRVGLDTVWFEQPPGEPSDTLRRMLCYITDPGDQTNYYRFLTKTNNQPFASGSNSVVDDKLFNGIKFKVHLPRRSQRNEKFDPVSYGLYRVGDTAYVKWANIDKSHFDFWSTLEFNKNNQGPFSSYTRTKTNINGGLGIWGGYYVNIYKLIVK